MGAYARHHPLDTTSTLCNNIVIASATHPIAHAHERTSRRTRDPAALCVNSGRRPTIELSHYRNDPLGFVRDILRDAGPLYHKQEEIFQALAADSRRASVVGCNSSGKDWAAARAILWWIETRPQAKVIISGPTLRQVHKSVWDELRAAHAACADRLEGRIKSGEYHAGPDRLALCLTSNNSQNLLGFHSPELMVVVTEAQGVKQAYFEALKRLNPKKMLLLGNPFSLTGEFYDSHHGKSDLYERVQISQPSTPPTCGRTAPTPSPASSLSRTSRSAAASGARTPPSTSAPSSDISRRPSKTPSPPASTSTTPCNAGSRKRRPPKGAATRPPQVWGAAPKGRGV